MKAFFFILQQRTIVVGGAYGNRKIICNKTDLATKQSKVRNIILHYRIFRKLSVFEVNA